MSSDRGRTKEEAIQVAKEMGLVPFFPSDYELFLDLDEPYAPAVMKMQARFKSTTGEVLMHNITIVSQLYTMSQGGNAHLYIMTHQRHSYQERVALHLILGSDPTREVYNLYRGRLLQTSGSYSIALFETQQVAPEVAKWRRESAIARVKASIQSKRREYVASNL
jgi:hypothetical protein